MTNPWWKNVTLCGKTYRFKRDLEADIRAVVARAGVGVPLTPVDTAFIVAVLAHHPEWAEKTGCGLAHIEVRINRCATSVTRGFWIVRRDGTAVDISWVWALAAKPMPRSQVVAQAARAEVIEQTRAVREASLGQPCRVCGEPLLTDVHVDHAPPLTFADLLAAWLDGAGVTEASLALVDGDIEPRFSDRALAADWQDFHRLFANLQAIHKHENLRGIHA